jgi:hypothetical protein
VQDPVSSFEVIGGVPVAAAPEEIDITVAPALRSALAGGRCARARDARRGHDLDRFCDSFEIHTLLAAHKRAQAGGGPAARQAPLLRGPVWRAESLTTIVSRSRCR